MGDLRVQCAVSSRPLPDAGRTAREIQTAVRLVLPGELAKHAMSEGTVGPAGSTKQSLGLFVTLPDEENNHTIILNMSINISISASKSTLTCSDDSMSEVSTDFLQWFVLM